MTILTSFVNVDVKLLHKKNSTVTLGVLKQSKKVTKCLIPMVRKTDLWKNCQKACDTISVIKIFTNINTEKLGLLPKHP